jgi:PAS domain S-box-containing protein
MNSESKKTILVVDDVPDDIAILEEVLKEEYRVKAATGGDAALAIARGDPPPDLILLDIMMPGMDGFEICRSLKQDSEGSTIPVIFLTAKEKAADERMGFELGAVDYIRKPIDPGIVKMRIEAHLAQKDSILRSSELRYRRLFETMKDGVIIVDAETGMIVDANPSLAQMMGLSQESFLGVKVWDLGFMKVIATEKDGFSDLLRKKYVRIKDRALETADGRSIYVECSCGSYQANHREVMQLKIRDITALVQAERERDEASVLLDHYLSTSPTVTYSLRIKDGKAPMQWVSANVKALLGYTVAEALESDWWLRNVHASDRMRALGGISKIANLGSYSHEYRFNRKDRSTVWIRDEMRFVQSTGGEGEIVGTLTDISDRKRIEAELSLKSLALDAAANAVVITDRDGAIKWTNPAFEALTGYARDEIVGKNPRLLKSGEQDAQFYRTLWETILAGKVWRGEMVNKRKGGELYAEEMTITPVLDEARSLSGFIAVKSDMTERKLSRERLEASLAEKVVLLREIHHRVNNNMQLIMSLLRLSSQKITDASLRDILDGVSRRLVSMALVHEQFYNSPDMARIDFLLYLQQLANGLSGEYEGSPGKMSIVSDTETVLLSLEQAIPAGLIAAELVTNALKHAYPGKEAPGGILVSLRRLGAAIELSVRDEGDGLADGFAADKAESLGMILVHALAEQLRGKIEFRRGAGTDAILRFPISR